MATRALQCGIYSDASHHTSNCRKSKHSTFFLTISHCQKYDCLHTNCRNSGNCRKTCITGYNPWLGRKLECQGHDTEQEDQGHPVTRDSILAPSMVYIW